MAFVEPCRTRLGNVNAIPADGAFLPPRSLLSWRFCVFGMHVANQTRRTEDVAALCHPRSCGFTQTNRTRCRLRLGRCNDLKNVVPVKMNVRIPRLCLVVSARVDNEAIIRVNVPFRPCQYAIKVCLRLVVMLHTSPCLPHDIHCPSPKSCSSSLLSCRHGETDAGESAGVAEGQSSSSA